MGKGIDQPPVMRRRLAPAIVTSLAALAVACGVAVPAPIAGEPSAPSVATATQASTRARAEAELVKLLAIVQVPPGAALVNSAPLAYLAQPPLTEGSPNLLTRTSWWRIGMPFANALAWINSHPPGGLQSGVGGQSGGPGVPTNEILGYQAPSTTAYDGASLNLELASISASETGLRADAEVIWLPPKPADEFVPAGAPVTLVAMNHYGETDATALRMKRLDPSDAAVIIKDLNSLLPSDGGIRGCGLDTGYRVQIDVNVAGTPMVFSDWWACFLIQVTRGSTTLMTLSPTMSFQDEVTRLIGAPPSP